QSGCAQEGRLVVAGRVRREGRLGNGAGIEGVRSSVGGGQSMRVIARQRVTDADGGGYTTKDLVNRHLSTPAVMEKDPLTVDVPREFHRRMAAIIDAVQMGV